MQRPAPPRRRPNAVDMTQAVAHDVGEALRSDFVPRVQRSGQDIDYRCSIHIRDGLPQFLDKECKNHDSTNTPSTETDKLPDLIKRAEMWVLKILPPKLIPQYHGRVEVLLKMEKGKFQLIFTLVQQRWYQWYDEHRNGNGRA